MDDAFLGKLSGLQELRPIQRAVAEAGGGTHAYLVGGAVRDLLLGRPPLDLDLAVEGDALSLARALAEQLGGRASTHPAFGTASVLYGGDRRLDVATARSEDYPAPGALPRVRPASIHEDLGRRDFTVNAMAAALADPPGPLIDPHGGREDLAARLVRVLHPRSFEDDPTRTLRAVRYEARLGFALGRETEALLHACLAAGCLDTISGARAVEELVLLLEEPEPGRAIERLGSLGLAAALQPGLCADAEAARLYARARQLRLEYALALPPWRAGLAILARRLPADELASWLGRLGLRRGDARGIALGVTEAPRLVERLRGDAPEPAEVVSLAGRSAPDGPLLALALEELEPLRRYFERLRGIRLELTGTDLAALGLAQSPRVGEVLAELRRRKLNGELDGREAELEAARALIAGPS
ncbi:MAG: CCA tRNA nucleotidyltransferase [Actinobacteria bacterium]|nr:CCA tRNA nucleotidyltransferase [Actinomycetota bacterium]